MADFRTKVITLVSVATTFAGMAYGQATLNPAPPGQAVAATQTFIRAEGQAELLPTSTVTIANSVAGSVTLIVVLGPSVTITSQSSSSKGSEITATSNSCAPAASCVVNGVVLGSQVTFSNIPTAAAGATTSIVISNIRVNASTVLVPLTAITETVTLTGTNAAQLVSTAPALTVAYVNNGLAISTVSAGIATNPVCTAASAGKIATPTPQFTINVAENFAGAFKTLAQESGTNANFPATNGTRIAVTLGNIPANVTVYAPLTIGGGALVTPLTATAPAIGLNNPVAPDTGVIQMIFSPTATTAGSNLAGAAGTSDPTTALGQVAIANGTGTIYYELTTGVGAALETYAIPIFYTTTAGGVTAAASAASVSVSFAPTGSTTNYPNFVVGTSTTSITKNTSSFTLCNTTLLFPYLTNSSGFESGIAIANTSIDNLGLKSGVPNGSNSVAAQSGTCTLSFYGSVTAASNPASYTTPIVTAGTTGTPFTLTSVAGAGFTGYMLANCNFQYAHGFTYIVSQFGANNGVAMGYVAYPLPQPRATVGGIEALGN